MEALVVVIGITLLVGLIRPLRLMGLWLLGITFVVLFIMARNDGVLEEHFLALTLFVGVPWVVLFVIGMIPRTMAAQRGQRAQEAAVQAGVARALANQRQQPYQPS